MVVHRGGGTHRVTATPRIALLGHVGNGNLGDETIVAAVVARLRAAAPGVELTAFTSNPPDTAARHGVPAFPIRPLSAARGPEPQADGPRAWTARAADRVRRIRWLKALLRPAALVVRAAIGVGRELRFDVQSYRRLRRVRVVVFTGSAQLSDDVGGPFAYPLTVLRWSVLARLRGAAVSIASMGAGPADTRLGRLFLRLALRLAAHRSFRDPTSLAVARGLGAPEPNLLVRDLALSHPRLAASALPARAARTPCVGINPLSIYGGANWQLHDRAPYDAYVEAHAVAARGLVEQGWRVVLFGTQIVMDPEPIRDVVERLRSLAPDAARAVETATGISEVTGLLELIEGFDLAVATRYHGVLLALASGVPTVAVAYHPKTRDLMEHFGLGAWCLAIEGLSGSALLERVKRLASDLPSVRAALAERRGRDLAELLVQYDHLLCLAGTAAASSGLRTPQPALQLF